MVEMTLHSTGVVVVVETNPGARHTAESMETDVAAFRDLTGDQALPAVWDVRRMSRPTAEGWSALVRQIPDVLTALALVVDVETAAIAGAFPAAINSFLFPARVFEDVTEAIEWAEEFVPADLELPDHGADSPSEPTS